jgi:hypothetical protein
MFCSHGTNSSLAGYQVHAYGWRQSALDVDMQACTAAELT